MLRDLKSEASCKAGNWCQISLPLWLWVVTRFWWPGGLLCSGPTRRPGLWAALLSTGMVLWGWCTWTLTWTRLTRPSGRSSITGPPSAGAWMRDSWTASVWCRSASGALPRPWIPTDTAGARWQTESPPCCPQPLTLPSSPSANRWQLWIQWGFADQVHKVGMEAEFASCGAERSKGASWWGRWGLIAGEGRQAETNQALRCCWLGKEPRRSRHKSMGLILGWQFPPHGDWGSNVRCT